MFITTAASVIGIAGGINSLTGGGITKMLGGGSSPTQQQAQQAVDPFASHRGELGDQYAAALKSGGTTDITKMPGYSQFQSGVMDPALEASKRSAAASGMLQSGGEQVALQKTAQQGYYGFMTDYLNRLATGSGATAGPAAGGQAGLNQGDTNMQNWQAGLGGIGQGVAGLKGYFGSGGDGGGGSNYQSIVNTGGQGNYSAAQSGGVEATGPMGMAY
jgi:hypothetical protein